MSQLCFELWSGIFQLKLKVSYARVGNQHNLIFALHFNVQLLLYLNSVWINNLKLIEISTWIIGSSEAYTARRPSVRMSNFIIISCLCNRNLRCMPKFWIKESTNGCFSTICSCNLDLQLIEMATYCDWEQQLLKLIHFQFFSIIFTSSHAARIILSSLLINF